MGEQPAIRTNEDSREGSAPAGSDRPEEPMTSELLVEEVSIDGMCGVY